MRISYDKDCDALSIIFHDTTVTTKELSPGITAEYDSEGKLVGIEILDAIKQLGDPSVLDSILVESIGHTARAAA